MHIVGDQPESYEKEHELGSEGEDAGFLKRSGARNDEEDEMLRRQDLTLARSLRLRAEGLEKVVTSMLEQPSDQRRRHQYTTKFTQTQALQASAYFTEWPPLALSPRHGHLPAAARPPFPTQNGVNPDTRVVL